MAQQLRPWGRFKLVSKDPAEESDHLYFYRNEHRIGRNRSRSDIILDKLFISSVHCVVTLEDADDDAEADESGEKPQYVVKILDLSRNAVYVNEERVGKSKTAVVQANDTIHFTKPGLNTKSISPTVYKFEIFEDGFSPENNRLRNGSASSSESTPDTHPAVTSTASVTSAASSATAADADFRPTQALAHGSPSVSIAPTQAMGSTQNARKRSVDSVEDVDVNFTASTSIAVSGERAMSVSSASGSGSGSSAKRQRRDAEGASDGAEFDTTTRIQHSNHDLRKRLQESKIRELALSKNLSEAEIEILSLTNKLEECQEHGKKLQEELYRKDSEAEEREQFIAQLKQEKTSLEANLAASAQVLRAANDRVKLLEEAVDDYEKEKSKLETNLTTVTAQLNTTMFKNSTLSEQVKTLEVKTRELLNAKLSVLSGREMVEEDKREVLEEKDMIGDTLADAIQVFEQIHRQVVRVLKAKTKPVVAHCLASRRRRQSEDSASTEHSSQGDMRNFTDSSLLLSENSQPTPVGSSELLNTQEPDESETMNQETALANAPLPTPFSTDAARPNLVKQRSSQDADDEGETQQLPPAAAVDDDEQETLDQQRGDSEESAVSVRSASKTPPAKSIRMSATPVHSQQDEKKEAEVEVVQQIVVVATSEVADTTEEPEQEGNVAEVDEEDKLAAAADDKPVAETKAGADDDDEDKDEGFVIAEQPATAGTKKDDEDQSEDGKKPDDSARDTTMTEQKQVAVEVEEKEDDGDDDDEHEPPVPNHSATEQPPPQRWLPTISHDESLDSQANASGGAGIFDDETQLSQ